MFQTMEKRRAGSAQTEVRRPAPQSLEEIELRTDRLTLRSFAPWDATDIAAPITPTLHRFINWDAWPSREGFTGIWHDWLTMMERDEAVALVVRRREPGSAADGTLVGMAGLHFLNREEPTVGIWIRDSLQGLGFGSEAMQALADWAFVQRHVEALFFPVFDAHEPSRRIAAKLGGTRSNAEMQKQAPVFRGPSPELFRIPRPAETPARGP